MEYAAGKIVAIDHKKKEYSEITLAEMEAAMKAAAAKMEEANTPDEGADGLHAARDASRRWSR